VIQIDQNGERICNDLVGLLSLHMAHEPDATRVVLELGIIEALFCWESGICHFGTKGRAFSGGWGKKSSAGMVPVWHILPGPSPEASTLN
jgi:hypothetical protein